MRLLSVTAERRNELGVVFGIKWPVSALEGTRAFGKTIEESHDRVTYQTPQASKASGQDSH